MTKEKKEVHMYLGILSLTRTKNKIENDKYIYTRSTMQMTVYEST